MWEGNLVVSLVKRDLLPPPNPQQPKRTPHTSCIAAPKVKSQPEDGPYIGPKHVVVVLV